MQVSIIMVNYNTLELTKEAIKSIIEKTKGIKYEILLVDNNSTDGSKEYFLNMKENFFKFIESPENLGFGKANNLAYKYAKGKYIFLLNTDTLLINNAIKILYDELEKNSTIGVVGGNLYNLNMEPMHSYGAEIYSTKNEVKNQINEIIKIVLKKDERILKNSKRKDFNYTGNILQVGYITGADMMIRKNVIEEVGFFDPDFFMYFEETELTNRIRKKNYKIISVPFAKIIHLEGKSSSIKENKIKMFNESKFKYFKKVYGEKYMYFIYYLNKISNLFKYMISFNNIFLKINKINKNIIQTIQE